MVEDAGCILLVLLVVFVNGGPWVAVWWSGLMDKARCQHTTALIDTMQLVLNVPTPKTPELHNVYSTVMSMHSPCIDDPTGGTCKSEKRGYHSLYPSIPRVTSATNAEKNP